MEEAGLVRKPSSAKQQCQPRWPAGFTNGLRFEAYRQDRTVVVAVADNLQSVRLDSTQQDSYRQTHTAPNGLPPCTVLPGGAAEAKVLGFLRLVRVCGSLVAGRRFGEGTCLEAQ